MTTKADPGCPFCQPESDDTTVPNTERRERDDRWQKAVADDGMKPPGERRGIIPALQAVADEEQRDLRVQLAELAGSCACEGQALLQVHTPTTCHDVAPTRPDAERDDQYAQAMAEAAGSKAFRETGSEWGHMRSSWRGHGAVARAVADEEQKELRAELNTLFGIVARLRADLHEARTLAARRESELIGRRAELEKARATVLRERADFLESVLRDSLDPDSDPRYCAAIHDVILGLRRLAAETAARSGGQAEAHPAEHMWAAELHDPLADEWVPGSHYVVRDRAVTALEHGRRIGPEWADGTPTERRLVRMTTTYTVEPAEQVEDGA